MAIYPDKGRDGKPTGRWRVEVQSNGQRARGRFDTIEEAKTKEKEWKKAFSLGDAPEVSKARLDNHGKPITLETLVRSAYGSLWHGQANERNNYQRLDIVISLLNNPRVDSITTSTIDTLAKKLRSQRKVGPQTLNRYYSVFLKLLKWAKSREFIKELPEFPWNKEKEGRIRVITPDEEKRLVQLLVEYGRMDIADLVRVAIVTGMRRGELLGLKRKDIGRGWVRLHGDQTKNGCNRSIPIDENTERLLLALMVVGMPHREVLRIYWDKAREAMGLAGDPWFVFHACRHTCASRLVEANVNLRVIQEWMGHKAIQTTLRYAHVRSENLENALEKLMAHRIKTPDLLEHATDPQQGDGAQYMGSVGS
jgi:integrase